MRSGDRRACELGERRDKEEGGQGLACRERQGASSGVLGRPEVAGGGWKGAGTVRERTVARSRACKWPACHFLAKWAWPGMSGSSRDE